VFLLNFAPSKDLYIFFLTLQLLIKKIRVLTDTYFAYSVYRKVFSAFLAKTKSHEEDSVFFFIYEIG
jgi:hypothetical protein